MILGKSLWVWCSEREKSSFSFRTGQAYLGNHIGLKEVSLPRSKASGISKTNEIGNKCYNLNECKQQRK